MRKPLYQLPNTSWADRLRYRREALGLTQDDVAYRAGTFDQQRVSKFETGKMIPDEEQKGALGVALNIKPSELFPSDIYPGCDFQAKELAKRELVAID